MRLITAPAIEPVTLAEVRADRRVTSTAEDSMLTRLITVARQECENTLRRALITQDWETRLDAWPPGSLALGPATVQSIVSVKYINTSGTLTTVSSSVYRLDADAIPAQLSLAYSQDWPTDIRDEPRAVRIVARCGYGDAAANVPENVRHWIIQRVGTLYEQREQIVIGASVAPTPFVDCLLDSERIAEAY